MRVAAVGALALVLMTSVLAGAVQRLVLIEDFTNFNCPPCDAIQVQMDSILALNLAAGKIAPLRPHVWWPDPTDPMYNWATATTDVQDRVTYYGVGYVPTFRYDGKVQLDPSDFGSYAAYYAAIQPMIDSLYAVSSPIRLRLTQQRYADSVRVSFDVIAVDESGGGLGTSQSLFLIVAELNQNFPTGKEWYIFRDMLPNSSGYPLTLAVNDSLHFDWAYAVTTGFSPTKLVTMLMVQKGNQKVLNTLYAPVANPTDVASEGVGPLRFRLEQNVPNPFNPVTAIPFNIERAGNVRLTIFDASGRRVTELVDGPLSSGLHRETWLGLDQSGQPVASGIYYYRLESENASETRKMTLLK